MDATTLTAPAAAASDRGADLDLLTGAAARDLLATALTPLGAQLGRWRAGEVTPQRGGVTVRYHAEVRWPDGRTTQETLAAATGQLPEGTVVLEDGVHRVAVWRLPFDPDLPGLVSALDADAVSKLLVDLGLTSTSVPVDLRIRAYRPRRRAVVQADAGRGRLFLKVVRPDRVEALHQRHQRLHEAGVPVPRSLGWSRHGILVLEALPGPTLRDALGTTRALPSGADLQALLDRIPADAADPRSRPSWLDRVGHYARVTATALPDQEVRLAGIVEAIEDEATTGPAVPVHGDFYDGQLLVQGGRVTGLLDIDTLRIGDRLDDLACLLGHLAVLAHHQPSRARAINEAGARYLTDFETAVDPVALRYRVAAVVVSLSTGPHRVQQANWERSTRALVDLAGRWVESARQVDRKMAEIS